MMYAFDPLELNGKDLRREPLLKRKTALEHLLARSSPALIYNEHLEDEGQTVFASACALGLEGIVSKRADSPYRSGRSRDWIKTKSPTAIAAQRVRSENWNK